MRVKALVLEANQHGQIALIDLGGLERQTPAPIGGGVGAQQAPVAVEHGDGKVVRNLERQRCQGEPTRPRGAECHGKKAGEKDARPAARPRACPVAAWECQPRLAVEAESTTMPNGRQPRERLMPGKRTTHRSSKGTKLYAVRNKKGQFEDIQTYKRAHGQDVKRKSKAEGKRKSS